MGGRLGWSPAVAGVVAATIAVLIAQRVRRKAGRLDLAVRFADTCGLHLPPDYADRLQLRLHRRATATTLIIGPVRAAWMGWAAYDLLQPESQFHPSAAPPQLRVLPLWAMTGLAIAAGHMYDLLRTSRREPGSRVARLVTPRLSDAVPPVLIWTVRAAGLIPAAAAIAWLFVPTSVQHDQHPARPHPAWYLTAALLGPVAVAATEWAQRRILDSRQNADTPLELAFDDALRVQAMLALLIVPSVLIAAAATLIATPLGRDLDWPGAFPIFTAMTATMFLPLEFTGLGGQKWASRHYRTRFAEYSSTTC